MAQSKKLIVICGPTATGKTKLGVALAKALGGEVVSADSMQVYRGMPIGTAQPTAEERDGVPHHMMAMADPSENYSVARYVEEATACVEAIFARGKQPILVGGTGLYIDVAMRRFFSQIDIPLIERRCYPAERISRGDDYEYRSAEGWSFTCPKHYICDIYYPARFSRELLAHSVL